MAGYCLCIYQQHLQAADPVFNDISELVPDLLTTDLTVLLDKVFALSRGMLSCWLLLLEDGRMRMLSSNTCRYSSHLT